VRCTPTAAALPQQFPARARRDERSAVDLSTPERILLFCLASGTEWAEAGVTGKTETAMVVRGLIDRDAAGRLVLTSDGRAVLNALLGD
jgi:hypothetical protein